MTVINSNISSLRASNASAKAQSQLSTAMERLSTGKRINSAKDDAAGLAIANSMTAQIRGMNQGIRNANDGISLAQTAEGALDEVSNMLQRMRELQVQKTNGTYDTKDIANITTEQNALATQIENVLTNTQFNGKTLFNGSGTNGADDKLVTIQAGANTADAIDLNLGGNLKAAYDDTNNTGGLGGVIAFGTPAGTDPVANPATSTALKTFGGDDALEAFDNAISLIASRRAELGAAQNQLESAVNNMTSNSTNLSDARSRIEDADFSAESTNLAKAQILSQASTAMLAQANQSQQGVMKLLG